MTRFSLQSPCHGGSSKLGTVLVSQPTRPLVSSLRIKHRSLTDMATYLPANLLLRASLASGRAVRAVSTTAVRLAGGEDSSRSGLRVHGNVLGGEAITAGAKQTFEAWHHALNKAKADPSTPQSELEDGLLERVHEKVHFHPPTYFKHWEGRDEFVLLIKTVSEVCNYKPVIETASPPLLCSADCL